jgi:hypothetical protein
MLNSSILFDLICFDVMNSTSNESISELWSCLKTLVFVWSKNARVIWSANLLKEKSENIFNKLTNKNIIYIDSFCTMHLTSYNMTYGARWSRCWIFPFSMVLISDHFFFVIHYDMWKEPCRIRWVGLNGETKFIIL